MSEASNTNESIIWSASPSKWLLFKPAIITTIAVFAAILASLSINNVVIQKDISFLYDAQVFLFNYKIISYAIILCAVTMIIKLTVMYLKIHFENYSFNSKMMLYSTGILNRDIDETMLFRIVDISVEIPILLRILGRGHLIIYSNDPSLESSGIKPSIQTPDGRKGVYLSAIKDPMGTKQILSNTIELERRKHATRSTELL